MKTYTKTYLTYFGYDESDFIPCECGCGKRAVDIHHLEPRSRRKDLINKIENLVALTRECHEKAETNKEFNNELKLKHVKKIMACTRNNELTKYISE